MSAKNYAQLTRIGPITRARRIFIAGIEGVGKTTALCDCENPVIICSEDGITEEKFSNVANYTPTDWTDVLEYIDWLIESDHEYKTLGIDTLDWLEYHAIKFICQRDGKQNIEDYGFSKGQSVFLPNVIRVLLVKLEQLQKVKNMLIVFTSHVQVKSFANPAGDNYDRFEAAGTKQVNSLVKQWCDVNLFATFNVTTYKESKKSKAKGVSGAQRIVHTTYSAAWDAKNRCGLPSELPFDMPTIIEAIKRGTPDTPENLYADAYELANKYLDGDQKASSLKFINENKANAGNLLRALNKLKVIASSNTTPELEAAKG